MTEGNTVYVIDGEEAVRESMSVRLEVHGLPACSFASVEEFLSAASSLTPGCVIADLRMPGADGIELLENLEERGLHFPVILMTGYGDVPLAVRALAAGAVEFIEKPFAGNVLIDSVLSALRPADGAPPQQAEAKGVAERLASLTAWEREVMDALVQGKPNKEIAKTLGVSLSAVEAYRANVMEKMDAPSLSALVRMAVAAGSKGQDRAQRISSAPDPE